MRIRVSIGGQSYTFADPEKAKEAAAGLAINAERYRRKAELCQRDLEKLTAALDKALAEDEARARAKKEAKK